jgi:hypothetical protein
MPGSKILFYTQILAFARMTDKMNLLANKKPHDGGFLFLMKFEADGKLSTKLYNSYCAGESFPSNEEVRRNYG